MHLMHFSPGHKKATTFAYTLGHHELIILRGQEDLKRHDTEGEILIFQGLPGWAKQHKHGSSYNPPLMTSFNTHILRVMSINGNGSKDIISTAKSKKLHKPDLICLYRKFLSYAASRGENQRVSGLTRVKSRTRSVYLIKDWVGSSSLILGHDVIGSHLTYHVEEIGKKELYATGEINNEIIGY